MKSIILLAGLVLPMLLASQGCKKKDAATGEPQGEVTAVVQNGMTEADKLIEQKKYDEAAAALLAMQMAGAIQSDADGWKYNNKMATLQDELSRAAASGDPKAKQAIEMIRARSMVR